MSRNVPKFISNLAYSQIVRQVVSRHLLFYHVSTPGNAADWCTEGTRGIHKCVVAASARGILGVEYNLLHLVFDIGSLAKTRILLRALFYIWISTWYIRFSVYKSASVPTRRQGFFWWKICHLNWEATSKYNSLLACFLWHKSVFNNVISWSSIK